MAGLVTEQNIAGKGFLRIDVHDKSGEKVLFSRMINPDSVYAINPVEKAIALEVGASSVKPVSKYEISNLLPEPKRRDAQVYSEDYDSGDLEF